MKKFLIIALVISLLCTVVGVLITKAGQNDYRWAQSQPPFSEKVKEVEQRGLARVKTGFNVSFLSGFIAFVCGSGLLWLRIDRVQKELERIAQG